LHHPARSGERGVDFLARVIFGVENGKSSKNSGARRGRAKRLIPATK
jgi:hypothetical protein